MSENSKILSRRVHIRGLVQGVGFRPFIYLLAKEYNIKGWVENRNDGVLIHAESFPENMTQFITSISAKAPVASSISKVEVTVSKYENFIDFQIVKSKSQSEEITEISPDIAVCDNCLNDLKTQPHRINYPFTNCTHCGPRFTIINDLPYDREKTSMLDFPMCPVCEKEYKTIEDRRFHAQPVACNHCGPIYSLKTKDHTENEWKKLITELCRMLENGQIVAMKGLGGYNLACDALNEIAVSKLRSIKIREGKPFAVMFRNIESVQKYAFLNQKEEEILSSWKRPIVLLKLKTEMAWSVTSGLNTIGIMLPYLPFHHLLFEKSTLDAIVLTSGNFSDEPIIINDDVAVDQFSGKTSAVVTNNRKIVNRTDDSVVFIANGKERIIRRSRGYVPAPIQQNYDVEGIFASGAELNNCFCIGKGKQAILSQHIGDLKNFETYEFYLESIDSFHKMFRFKPKIAVSDLHPDYLSSKYAAELGLPHLNVQHHHAHIASVMAEFGLKNKVIGIAFDGVGLGTDGNIWGGEFFICDLKAFERVLHFEYIPVPGGDKAAYEPWRTALSYLYRAFGDDLINLNIPLLHQISHQQINQVIEMIKNKVNSPLYSSAGRLFDAVAAMTGICHHAKFHSEAPMRLEGNIIKNTDYYCFTLQHHLSFNKMIIQIVDDLIKKIPVQLISTKFHNTIIQSTIETVRKIHKETKINDVVLSGGSFQNRYLLEKMEEQLEILNFNVFSPFKIPSNDAGIALGQLVIGKMNS